MKKSIVLFLALCLTLVLTACNSGGHSSATPPPLPMETPNVDIPVSEYEEELDCEPEYEYEYETEEYDEEPTGHHPGGEALGLTIVRLEDGNGPGPLGDVTFTHTLNYSEVVEVRDGSANFDPNIGDTFMIQTLTPLRDFAVVLISNGSLNDERIFFPLESFGTVENFLPGEAFVVHSYRKLGTNPWSGITFLDESGQRYYFAILKNQADEGDPYFLIPLESRGDHLVVTRWFG